MHTCTLQFSGHGDASAMERVVTLAGEEVDLAIATDHNHQTDYSPFQEQAGLTEWFTPVIGNGCVIDPKVMLEEMATLRSRGIDPSKVLVSGNAHLIMPYHRKLDHTAVHHPERDVLHISDVGQHAVHQLELDRRPKVPYPPRVDPRVGARRECNVSVHRHSGNGCGMRRRDTPARKLMHRRFGWSFHLEQRHY